MGCCVQAISEALILTAELHVRRGNKKVAKEVLDLRRSRMQSSPLRRCSHMLTYRIYLMRQIGDSLQDACSLKEAVDTALSDSPCDLQRHILDLRWIEQFVLNAGLELYASIHPHHLRPTST